MALRELSVENMPRDIYINMLFQTESPRPDFGVWFQHKEAANPNYTLHKDIPHAWIKEY